MPRVRAFLIGFRTFWAILLASLLVGAGLEGLRELRAQGPGPGLDVRLTRVEGIVDVKLKGETDWAPADKDTPLEAGDEVRTAPGARAELGWGGQSLYELQEAGDVVLSQSQADKKTFDLAEGTLLLEIRKHEPGETVDVRTKTATVRDTGTDYGVSAKPDGSTSAGVFSGEVRVSAAGAAGVPGAEVSVPAGKEFATDNGAAGPRKLKTFLLFQDRVRELTERRIILRRDWKPLSVGQREDQRKTFYQDRAARAAARDTRLKQAELDAKAAQVKAAAERKKPKKVRRKHKRPSAPTQESAH